MKNTKIFWTEVTTHKITKNEAKELYDKLIQKDIDTLEKSKSNKPEKQYFKYSQKFRHNIYWRLYALQRCA